MSVNKVRVGRSQDGAAQPLQEWKKRVHSIDSREWVEEVASGKSSLSWYRKVKEVAGLGHEELRLR